MSSDISRLRRTAGSLRRRGSFEEAERILTRMIDTPDFRCTPTDYLNRAACRTRLGRIQDAIADYSEALRQNPRFATAMNNRAFLYANYVQPPNYDSAYREYGRAIQLAPNCPLYWENRASIYLRMKERNLALSDARRALSLATRGGRSAVRVKKSYNLRGKIYASKGMHREALSDFSRALEMDSEMGRAKTNRGMSYFALGRYREALQDFSSIIIVERLLVTNRCAVLWRRAFCRCVSGAFDAASSDLAESFQLDETFSDLQVALMEIGGLAERFSGFFAYLQQNEAVQQLHHRIEGFLEGAHVEVEEDEDWGERVTSARPAPRRVKRVRVADLDPQKLTEKIEDFAVVAAPRPRRERRPARRRKKISNEVVVGFERDSELHDPRLRDFLSGLRLGRYYSSFVEQEIVYDDLPRVIRNNPLLLSLIPKRMPRERLIARVRDEFQDPGDMNQDRAPSRLEGRDHLTHSRRCPLACVMGSACWRFLLESMKLQLAYFDTSRVLCLCRECISPSVGYVTETNGMRHSIPRGYARFTLQNVDEERIQVKNWHVAFHGTNFRAAREILRSGMRLAIPDDVVEGARIESVEGHIQDPRWSRKIFVSKSIVYSAKYSRRMLLDGQVYEVAFVVRIRPGSYEEYPHTLSQPGQIDPNFRNSELEWCTEDRSAVVLTDLLVKVLRHRD